jgi:DNA repair protein RadC
VQTARDLLQAHGPCGCCWTARPRAGPPAGARPGTQLCTLAAGLELAHRYLAAELEHGEAVGNNPAAVGRYLQHRLRGQAREIFMACSWTTATA